MEKRIIKLGTSNACTPHGNTYEDYYDKAEVKSEEKEAQEEKDNNTEE